MTAKDDYVSKEKDYQVGIDDYMVRPIDLNELVLRIGALLRRANIASENKLTVGSFMMNADDMTAVCNGEEIALTAREFNILFKLLSYPKRIFTRAPAHGGILGRGHGSPVSDCPGKSPQPRCSCVLSAFLPGRLLWRRTDSFHRLCPYKPDKALRRLLSALETNSDSLCRAAW